MTDDAWRALVGLAASGYPALARLHRCARLRSPESAALAAALPPCRAVPEWFQGMARVAAAGRRPTPRDYWSTREDALG